MNCLPSVFVPQLVICLHESYENWEKDEIKKHSMKTEHNFSKARAKEKSFVHTNTLLNQRISLFEYISRRNMLTGQETAYVGILIPVRQFH